jgi:hypothetical protein
VLRWLAAHAKELVIDGPDDVGQGDLGCGPGEPEAAVGTALAAHDVAAPQVRQDGLKERAGDILRPDELLGGDVAVGRGGQFDRGAERVVGTGGHSHNRYYASSRSE